MSSGATIVITMAFLLAAAPVRAYLTATSRRVVNSRSSSSSSSTRLHFFGDLQKFFTTGGAYDAKVDYDALDHPGPLVAGWAKEGMAPKCLKGDDGPLEPATFAGGCFWGLELAFQRMPGVTYTLVGYTQGRETFPTYDQVVAGNTGHAESVVVWFDPSQVTYESLLTECFLARIDPTTVDGQGRDFGRQYRTGIYYHTPEQENVARGVLSDLSQSGRYAKPIATECRPATPFWPAEKYHQRYLEKGGRFGNPQSATKGATDEIRCYG